MIISQNRLTRMIEDQRAMFPGERLLVDEVCLATGHDPAEGVKHNFNPDSCPGFNAAVRWASEDRAERAAKKGGK